jgi:hypothetical protein
MPGPPPPIKTVKTKEKRTKGKGKVSHIQVIFPYIDFAIARGSPRIWAPLGRARKRMAKNGEGPHQCLPYLEIQRRDVEGRQRAK